MNAVDSALSESLHCAWHSRSTSPIRTLWIKTQFYPSYAPTYCWEYKRVDTWKTYDCLKDEGCGHLTVNHILIFVDRDTGAHTKGVEITWRGVKDVCLVQKHPKISSKVTYRNGFGVSIMEMNDPFENINIIWSTQICVNCSSYQCVHCPCSDRHFIEERNNEWMNEWMIPLFIHG